MYNDANCNNFVSGHVLSSNSLSDHPLHHRHFVFPSLYCNFPCNSKVHLTIKCALCLGVHISMCPECVYMVA